MESELPVTGGRKPGQLPSGRHSLPREFVVRNQQMRIIDALARTVGEKGYARTSVGDVLEAAGVSRATFYQHYRSKDDCFQIAFEAIADGLVRRVAEAYEGEGGWTERVTRAIARFLSVLASEPLLARMCMVEALSAGPEAREIYGRALARFEVFFEDGMKEMGGEREAPERLPWATTNGLAALAYREILGGRAEALPEMLPDVVYFVLAPYVGRDEALEASRAT